MKRLTIIAISVLGLGAGHVGELNASAAEDCAAPVAVPEAKAEAQTKMEELVVNTTFVVPESSADVDTNIDVQDGDYLIINGHGQIWAGVWLTDNNGPQGWNYIDNDPKFPLVGSHPFALIGKLDNTYFYIGTGVSRFYRPGTAGKASRLYLRTNDDTPGNGSGAFSAAVQIRRTKE